MKIIIMGPQGCGKSTQAKLLSKNLKIPSVSSGDIFRELKNTNTLLGKRVVERLSKGLLVSDDDTMDVINQELSKKEYKKGFIIEHNGDNNETRITGQIIIKGNIKDPLDVS